MGPFCMSERSIRDEVLLVNDLTEQVTRILDGNKMAVVGAVLADVLAALLNDQPRFRRGELLDLHISYVKEFMAAREMQ